ncbi:hypothetical protein [Lentzea sp. NPDC003310]|uniref:hypothetical protein n=1 Tax=Lentzea sp. NPDC003310 TaxID=3154447 RepID=UPI0033AD0C44
MSVDFQVVVPAEPGVRSGLREYLAGRPASARPLVVLGPGASVPVATRVDLFSVVTAADLPGDGDSVLLLDGYDEASPEVRSALPEYVRAVGRPVVITSRTWVPLDADVVRLLTSPDQDAELHAELVWCALRERAPEGRLRALLSLAPLSLRVLADGVEHADGLVDLVREMFARAGAFEAVHRLNLVLLHVVLAPSCAARDIGVRDWPRLATFWKSQLSSEEWRSLIRTLSVRWDVPCAPVLSVTTVDRKVPEAVLEARFTGDPVSSEISSLVEALPPGRCDVEYARAVLQLAASPVAPWERAAHYLWWADKYPDLVLDCLRRDVTVGPETLAKLAKTPLGESSAFAVQVYDRIGRGGADAELLGVTEVLPRAGGPAEIAMLDAWLRLHEQGHEHRRDLRAVLGSVDFAVLRRLRPDLVYRCGTVAHEIGLFG